VESRHAYTILLIGMPPRTVDEYRITPQGLHNAAQGRGTPRTLGSTPKHQRLPRRGYSDQDAPVATTLSG